MNYYRTLANGIGIFQAVDEACPEGDERREQMPDNSWFKNLGNEFPDAVSFWSEAGNTLYKESGLMDWHNSLFEKGNVVTLVQQIELPEVVYRDENQIIVPRDFSLENFSKIFQKLGVLHMPEILKDDYKELYEGEREDVDVELVKKYFEMMIRIKSALEKVQKYPLYFVEFYPSSESITKQEALEHNIHSLLQDIYILREKILTFLNMLKKDLLKISENKDEVEQALDFLKGQLIESFENAVTTRNTHTHGSTSFSDYNVTVSSTMQSMLNGPLPEEWNKEKAFELLTKKSEEAFDTAKQEWIDKAQNICTQTVGITEDILTRNKSFVEKVIGTET